MVYLKNAALQTQDISVSSKTVFKAQRCLESLLHKLPQSFVVRLLNSARDRVRPSLLSLFFGPLVPTEIVVFVIG